jgi:putative membrane protein
LDFHQFKKLSSVNLLLSFGLVLYTCKQTHIKFYGSLLLIGIFGFCIEVLGVKTGYIFGHYFYGNAFGTKLYDVPLILIVNWALLIYSTSLIFKTSSTYFNATISAFLMVILDYFIEQSASNLDFWYWLHHVIPIQNYVAWFVISFILNLIFQKIISQKSNSTATGFYVVQLTFFILLFVFKYKFK